MSLNNWYCNFLYHGNSSHTKEWLTRIRRLLQSLSAFQVESQQENKPRHWTWYWNVISLVRRIDIFMLKKTIIVYNSKWVLTSAETTDKLPWESLLYQFSNKSIETILMRSLFLDRNVWLSKNFEANSLSFYQ